MLLMAIIVIMFAMEKISFFMDQLNMHMIVIRDDLLKLLIFMEYMRVVTVNTYIVVDQTMRDVVICFIVCTVMHVPTACDVSVSEINLTVS